MSRLLALTSLLITLSLAGCYRTHYVNLQPPGSESPAAAATKPGVSSWQHFFLWGWVPSERVIDASKLCGIDAQVREIHTQQTFVEGLVQQLASYYVNIYAPYDAEVFCAPLPSPPLAAEVPHPSGDRAPTEANGVDPASLTSP